ncbi:discoidin domain-containing protein [Actinospica sp. MGRD01-02]|uniref:Discoidin domain-containing protein n=1 Tax=Actinospica acidithermotolerans TaxID=2828514 RepID=A0A941EGS3_9ACTN|nr:discoidin domain-containing protein [Actinospica acidithermotolerans]MBR7830350.1 discoidin domain-containing protein [Actinospica acidithermotolerans]
MSSSSTIRALRRALGLTGSAALLLTGVTALSTAAAAPASAATAAVTGGSGASLPYAEVQAESSPTNGTIIGPSYTQGQLADEASGRQAVTLSGSGAYVTFTTPVATNSIDFRYSIPDSSDGSVYTAPLSLYVNGSKQADFSLTNAYSWYYGSYPFTNTPSSGNPHHFYDEAHRLLSTTYPAGTTFKLQVDSEDTASSYTIDLADFEDVAAPLSQPAGSVSVTSEGADPTGAADSTSAFNAAIAAAGSGGTVWIPQGTYDIPGHISVNNVTIAGAGMWYSTVTGAAPGFYGNSAPNPSTNVHLQNFAISGNVQERNDSAQVNGIGGAMSNSTVSNIWIEHMKVGAWMDGPMSNLTFSGMRIRDTTADGINLHGGVTGSTITDSDVRNTGDDGIALWADSGIGADSQDTISDNTVQLQQLANGIAGYGGNNNTITGNRVVDTGITQGGGIQVGQRFSSTPVGLYTISNNTLIRDGSLDPNWQFGVGALWFDGSQGTIAGPINVSNALIEQSPYEAIQWVEGTINGVNLSNVSIQGTGTFALQEQTGGTASATNVTATGVAQANAGNAPSYSCEGTAFAITDGGGNSGISPTQCGSTNPTPVYPPYPATGVQTSPSALNFGSQVSGTTSSAQTVAVTNPTSSAAAVSSISTTGDFAETSNCGSSIAANGSCSVSVTFTPTASGSRTGTLTVVAGGQTDTVSLSGTGTAAGPVLSTNPASLTYAGTIVGSSAAGKSVTVTNTGTASATVSGVSVSGDYSQTNNCGTLAVNATCTVTVTFTPTAAGSRTGTLTITSNANNSPTTVGLAGTGIGSTTNLALTGTMTSSSSASGYPATNTNDGNTSTYWESTDGAAYPQTLTANLGQSYPLGSVTVTLPPSSAWSTRTETFSVLGSANGSSWTTLVASTGYTFNPSTGNTVTFNLPSGTTDQYLQLSFTGNTGWSAAQVSEFEIFPGAASSTTGGGGGGTTPTDLALNAPVSASSYTQTYVPANAVDGNTSTYWESTDGVWPSTLTINLGAKDSLSSVVVDLPPSSAWSTRTQTFSILGSTDNSTWTTLVSSATYTFNPSTGNTVTITLPSGTADQYVELDFTANSVQNGAQVSELQVMGTTA